MTIIEVEKPTHAELFGNPMVTVIRGLPGSGKTTAAIQMVNTYKDVVRINRDSIRDMLFDGAYSPDKARLEKMVWESAITHALCEGKSIVIDDAGMLNPKTLEALKSLLGRHGLTDDRLIIDDHLLSVSVQTCIEQDRKRMNSVGESVIRKFQRRYLPTERREINPDKRNAAIFDVDGCLSDMCVRDVLDWEGACFDFVNQPIKHLMTQCGLDDDCRAINDIFILTGRECTAANDGRSKLMNWLDCNSINHHGEKFLITRTEGDRRPAADFKRQELYAILETHNIVFLVDDDPTVIDMAKSLGIATIQPDFLGRSEH